MKMRIKMKLLSDAVFGSGISVPGGEDISILCDSYGFPYYKGSTFKGVFREELTRFLGWTMDAGQDVEEKVSQLLGKSGDTSLSNSSSRHKVIFSNFMLSEAVRAQILDEIETDYEGLLDNRTYHPELVTDSLSHMRTFTKLDEEGIVQDGSLRNCRCVNKNLIFYSDVYCDLEDMQLIKDVLSMIKWIGSMRNRGFGKVMISAEEKEA